jgi:hypothetical protein
MTRLTWRVSALAGLAVFALSSCASSIDAEDPITDHTEAWTELDKRFLAVQGAVGGEWEYLDGGARPCERGLGTGAQSPLGRTGQGVPLERQQDLVDEVVAQWTAADLPPQVGSLSAEGSDIVTVRYPASGWDEDGMYFEVRISERSTALLGHPRCVAGDYD